MSKAIFIEILKERKLKITPQRIAILEELEKKGHSTVDDIFNGIKLRVPSISLATVYKNILALQSADIIKSIKTPTHKQKYELNAKPHVHLFCRLCEKLQDFEININDFKTYCKVESGYHCIDEASILLTGICKDCSEEQSKAI